jgi:hypothetical protein
LPLSTMDLPTWRNYSKRMSMQNWFSTTNYKKDKIGAFLAWKANA